MIRNKNSSSLTETESNFQGPGRTIDGRTVPVSNSTTSEQVRQPKSSKSTPNLIKIIQPTRHIGDNQNSNVLYKSGQEIGQDLEISISKSPSLGFGSELRE